MAGQNSSGSPNSNELLNCTVNVVASFEKSVEESMWRVNALLLASGVLAGLIVGIGVYGQRYRHHRFTRFIFFGATTLFLPIISTVVSMGAGSHDYIMDHGGHRRDPDFTRLIAKCQPVEHSVLVVIWASLVQIIIINCSTVVAVDEREGGNTGPPFQLLVQGVWTFYLGISYAIGFGIDDIEDLIGVSLEATPFALMCAKMVLKYYAYEKARQSFALGRNPHLIFGYMQQPLLQETSQQGEPAMEPEDAPPPPLLVMGEERRRVEKQPHGYVFKDESAGSMLHKSNGLVTIDSVWKLGSMPPMSTVQRLKDLCLSFALFKLLRCRLARYKLTSARYNNDTISFFWSLMLKDGGHDRVFRVISDELSFVHDYYYSSLPISYSKSWLPIVGIFISLLTIAYCIFASVLLTFLVVDEGIISQIWCKISCTRHHLESNMWYKSYGSWYFDLVPIFLLLVLVVISEVRDIASYIFSSWTKVALMCRLLNQTTSQHSLAKNKWIGLLLRRRCKLMRHWDEKMGQCSVLGLQPRTTPTPTPLVFLWRLLRLPDQKTKVKVPEAVKVSIIHELRRSKNGCLSAGTSPLRRSQAGDNFLWACNNKGTSDTILTWHIATSILEIRYPNRHDQEQVSALTCNSDDKIVATHLSRYCAYLVTWYPELLPDNDAWSKSLYEDVKMEVEPALTASSLVSSAGMLTPLAEYEQLVDLLCASAKHEVLKNGVRLGKELAELIEDEETAWKFLAGFWSEMILYVAPSDNLKGHSEAIARGGELVTLLWAFLTHAGIICRPGDEDRYPDAAGATTAV